MAFSDETFVSLIPDSLQHYFFASLFPFYSYKKLFLPQISGWAMISYEYIIHYLQGKFHKLTARECKAKAPTIKLVKYSKEN